jgi:hypothetical protein
MTINRLAALAAMTGFASATIGSSVRSMWKIDHAMRQGSPMAIKKGKTSHKANARKAKKGRK